MCGVFTTIFESEDLAIGSVIIAIGQLLFTLIIGKFTLTDLKDVLYDPQAKQDTRSTIYDIQDCNSREHDILA